MSNVLTDAEDERLLTGYAGRMALVLALGWLAVLLGRQALPPLLPAIIDELSISAARAGFSLTLLMGLYSLLQYPAGRLSDALSRTTVLVASVGVTVLGFGLLATARTYPQLLVGAAVVGAGSAFYFTPSRALLSDLFVERRGQAFGLQTTAGMAGAALAAGLAVVALDVATWQAAFLPTVVLLSGVGVLLHRRSHEPYVLSGESLELDLRATAGRIGRSPRVRRLLAAQTLFAVASQGVIGFLPTLLQVEKGFSPAAASGGFALVFVVGGVTGPLAGRLSDRFPRPWIVLGGLAWLALGLGTVVVAAAAPAVLAGVVALAVGIGAPIAVTPAYLMDLFPDDSVGGDFGAAKTVYTGVGSLGPTYVGLVAVRAGYTAAFATLVPPVLLGIGLVATLTRGDG